MTRHVARVARIFFTGTAFVVFWLGGAFLAWVIFPLIRLRHRRHPTVAVRRCRLLLNLSLRLHAGYMRFFRLIAFDSRSVERQVPRGGFVMVANHPSLIDAVLLLSTFPTLYCVVKGSVMRSPFVGSMLRYCNHIDAGDGDPVSGANVVQGAIERLQSGDPVLIFPEGTRSPENGVAPFKRGAFAIAQAAGVPVVPIRIDCHPRGLKRGQKWYQVPDGTMHYRFRLFPPRLPAEYAGDAAAMARDVRSLFLD
jgi:1-acyl-sn-glycerol-3-phosphate acyltransferase